MLYANNYDTSVRILTVSCNMTKTTTNLHHDLFRNYVNDVRPVMDPRTTTNVTFRLAFRNLLALVSPGKVQSSTIAHSNFPK